MTEITHEKWLEQELVRVNHEWSEERRAIEQKAQRFTAAIDQSAELVIMLGPSGRIEYVNPAFSREIGQPPEEMLGRSPRKLHLSPADPKVWREIRRSLAAGRGWQGRYVTRRDGSPTQALTCSSPTTSSWCRKSRTGCW